MLYLNSNTSALFLKTAVLLFFVFLLRTAGAQNGVLVVSGETILKSRAKGLGMNVGVKKIDYKTESLEGVSIEVKKNGTTILRAKSEKKGKFSFEVPVSITDSKNDFEVYFTKDGTGPRMLDINAFIPKGEPEKYAGPKYECELEVPFYETTIKDIPTYKAFAKIKWDKVKEHKFTIDDIFSRSVLGEERKLMADPDTYYAGLAKKKARQDAILAKKQAAEEAKRKAEELAQKEKDAEIARQAALMKEKLREEIKEDQAKGPEKIKEEKVQALKQDKKEERIPAGKTEVENNKTLPATADTKPNIKDVLKASNDFKDSYDASMKYSISIARNVAKAQKDKRNKEKGKNLSSKYESLNILTSLLDAVVEYDKRSSKQ